MKCRNFSLTQNAPRAVCAKHSKGFTFIEMIVALTLMVLLTQIAATTAYNLLQAVTSFRTQFESLKYSISGLYGTVSSAKMAYEADLAFAVANGLANPNDSAAQAAKTEAQSELGRWNSSAYQSNPSNLINMLLNTDVTPNIKKASYLPTSLLVNFWTSDNNGNLVQSSQTVQITDYNSLLRAFLLTNTRTPNPSDIIVASLTLGMILDAANNISPTLPQIDWRRGTLQEILFPQQS